MFWQRPSADAPVRVAPASSPTGAGATAVSASPTRSPCEAGSRAVVRGPEPERALQTLPGGARPAVHENALPSVAERRQEPRPRGTAPSRLGRTNSARQRRP